MENTRPSQPRTRNRSHSLFHNWVSISKVLLFNSINIQIISNGKDSCCASLIFYVYIAQCFTIFISRRNPYFFFFLHIPRNLYEWKWEQKHEAISSARRWIHHCQLSDKSSCNISKDIWYFSPYFIFYIYIYIPRFLSEPLTIFCGTLNEKLCCINFPTLYTAPIFVSKLKLSISRRLPYLRHATKNILLYV